MIFSVRKAVVSLLMTAFVVCVDIGVAHLMV